MISWELFTAVNIKFLGKSLMGKRRNRNVDFTFVSGKAVVQQTCCEGRNLRLNSRVFVEERWVGQVERAYGVWNVPRAPI